MFILLSALFLLTVRASGSEDLIIFDNFDNGELLYGSEDKMVDYLLLALDKNTNLPPSFTICSSVHLNFITSPIVFYQLYQDDGKPWFNLYIQPDRDLKKFRERIIIEYVINFLATPEIVPIEPNSWYHGCTALDTVTGHILVVINGQTIFDNVVPEFIDSADEKPRSLEGRLSLFKNYGNGYWYLSRQRLTNLNVFSSALTIAHLVNITQGEKCFEEGDYLS